MAPRQDRSQPPYPHPPYRDPPYPDPYPPAPHRLVAALVRRDADPARLPFRGTLAAVLAGVLITVIAVGVVAVWARFAGGTG